MSMDPKSAQIVALAYVLMGMTILFLVLRIYARTRHHGIRGVMVDDILLIITGVRSHVHQKFPFPLKIYIISSMLSNGCKSILHRHL